MMWLYSKVLVIIRNDSTAMLLYGTIWPYGKIPAILHYNSTATAQYDMIWLYGKVLVILRHDLKTSTLLAGTSHRLSALYSAIVLKYKIPF